VNQNVNGIIQAWKLEAIIQNMIDHNIDAYLIQETWLPGVWTKEICGYLLIHHNHGEEGEKMKKRGREKRGVAVILSSTYLCTYDRAGNPQPITTDLKSNFSGRFIGVLLSFPNFDSYGKKIKGELKVFLASVYNPYEEDLYDDFNDADTSLCQKIPSNAIRIFGQDINANVGIRNSEDNDLKAIIGPHGFDNRNEKREQLLHWLASQQMRIANTFFEHGKYCTHKSYLPPKLPQMLDIFSISQRDFAKVHNCMTCEGIPSDHEAVELRLSLSAIKHSGEKKIARVQSTGKK
jgi:hypothetical protein